MYVVEASSSYCNNIILFMLLKGQDSEKSNLAKKVTSSDENCSSFGRKCQVSDLFKDDAIFFIKSEPTFFLFVTQLFVKQCSSYEKKSSNSFLWRIWGTFSVKLVLTFFLEGCPFNAMNSKSAEPAIDVLSM